LNVIFVKKESNWRKKLNHKCEGYPIKGKCFNLVLGNFWLCFSCWQNRESEPEFRFSKYTPPNLLKNTIFRKSENEN